LAHPYIRFRIRLAQHALKQFAASLKSSAQILLLVFAQVLVGLFALIALPPMYAASLALPFALPLLAAHALLMTVPMLLLRKRVLPQDVVRWLHALPVPPRVQLRADALVAAMLAGPLALAYAASGAIWLAQRPDWLLPARGVLGALLSFLLTWACSTAVLTLRARRPPASGRWQHRLRAAPPRYAPRTWRPRTLFLWHRLYWLPFWRAENVVGWQQCVLLLGALACAVAWMMAPPGVPRGALDLCASALLVLLTDRGDKAVREQADLLRPASAGWPLAPRALEPYARAFALAPALLVLLVLFCAGAPHGAWDRSAGKLYLALACGAQLALVALPAAGARTRVGLVVAAIVLLTAVGSELWI